MQSIVRIATILLATTICLGVANASGPIAVYALVDKVTFEPNAEKPERVRISGVFITAEERSDRYSAPQRGYLYFTLPATRSGTGAARMGRSEIRRRDAPGSGAWIQLGREGACQEGRRGGEVSRRSSDGQRHGQDQLRSAESQGAVGLQRSLNGHGIRRMGSPADGNLAVLPPRLHSGGVRRAARCDAGNVAARAGHRPRRVVEREHDRSQFHPSPLLSIGRDEPPVLRRVERSPGHSADALARPSPGASRGHRVALTRLAATGDRDRAGPVSVVYAGCPERALLPAGVSSGLSCRAGVVRDAGALGTRARPAHQPLRTNLQFPVFQRRLPRGAPRRSLRFIGRCWRIASRPARLPARGRPCCAGSMCRRWRLSNTWCCGRPACSVSSCIVTEEPFGPCCRNW